MTTVISHFFNEEYLLQWWMPHHVKMFDHGIMIDYASTDRSLEIIRHFAPNWEIRSSRNEYCSAVVCDAEVMDIEDSIKGWKLSINTTEFLHGNLGQFVWNLNAKKSDAATIKAAIMVDPPHLRDVQPDPNVSLIQQRHYGLRDCIPLATDSYEKRRNRLVHRHSNGKYRTGRHESDHQGVAQLPNGLMILWYGFAPWTPETRARKLQIQTRIPDFDKRAGNGRQHFVDEARLEEIWAGEAQLAVDLRVAGIL